MDAPAEPKRAPVVQVRRASALLDVVGGAGLGALLGILVGLSTSPVVSIVITALVALLGGLFGIAEKTMLDSAHAARRMAGFAIAAALTTPIAVWVRASDILGPSVESQKLVLVAMGIIDPVEQKELLKYQRFGVGPGGSSVGSGKNGEETRPAQRGVLYSIPAGFCDNAARMRGASVKDWATLFEAASQETARLARAIAELPADQQRAAFEAAPIYLCRGAVPSR